MTLTKKKELHGGYPSVGDDHGRKRRKIQAVTRASLAMTRQA